MRKEVSFEVDTRQVSGWRQGHSPPAIDSPGVLALHGWLDNADSFEPLAHSLVHRDLLAVDFPGHGRSDPIPAGCWYHYIDSLSVIDQVLDALAWDQVDLLGHSMGGALALLYAMARPERVRSVVSIDIVGPLTDPTDGFASTARKALQARRGFAQTASRFDSAEVAIKARCRGGVMREIDSARLTDRGLTESEGQFYWHADQRLKAPSLLRMTESQLHAALSSLKVPVQVILAEEQRYPAFAAIYQQRLDCLASVDVVHCPGGHHLHMEHPQDVADDMARFWSGLRPASNDSDA